ncbi:hypothetical protein [Methylocucumis oryzae]|uniref:Uncharacterized protein n=1 Tax=Methylocucumis oryzae TaxID=1632867 RepID=A0A0F3ILN8_9GAMM|nr:hypothetical protein [Methylocucumis oryzae]KJV07448.1 hypothetical protein VZ94_04665 [Methylocucumis oryzae]
MTAKIVTANGNTAGIDMALAIVKKSIYQRLKRWQRLHTRVMLDMQYDPQPPVAGGSIEKTEPAVYKALQELYDYFSVADSVKAIPIQ